jgi:O-antigen ligase
MNATAGGGELPPAHAAHEQRLLSVARGAAITALIAALVSPPFANVAAAVLLASVLLLPSLRQRLGAVLALPVVRAALLLLAVLAVAMLWSEAPLGARWKAWWDWRPLLLLILCLAVFDEPSRRRGLVVFVAAVSIAAAFSFWAWTQGISPTGRDHGLPGIVARNPITQGMGFAAGCFLALVLALGDSGFGRRARLLLAAAAAFILANLIFVTSGRSGHVMLLILLAGAGVQLLAGWRRVATIVALPLLAAAAFSLSPMLQARFGMMVEELRAPLASEHITSMGIRTVMWRVSLDMARERPLLGYGTGGFPDAYEHAIRRSSYTGWAATPTVDPHNQYLQVQLQAGIAGSAAFAWFLLSVFRVRGGRQHGAWAKSLLLGWCAAGLATSVFTTFAESHLLMLLLGLLLPGAGATSKAPATAA